MDQGLVDRFKGLVGPLGWIEGADPQAAAYTSERRGRWIGQTPLVLRPRTTAEVSAVLALANSLSIPVVPQGGNTGLVGGQIPAGPQDQFILSLQRMNLIRRIDPAADCLIAEAGVPLAQVQAAALEAGRFFPLSLASEGTATIGGLISTNAGGTAVLRYGNMRSLVLGLEAVLADGRVINRLQTLRKDNTGLDLKQLFIGTEGLHGIVTAASLALYPQPRNVQTGFIALTSIDRALDLLAVARRTAGGRVSAFEVIPRIGLEFLARHMPNLRQPPAAVHDWYVLIEVEDSSADDLTAILADALSSGLIADGVIAESTAQADAFWALRENMSDVQGYEGGSIKHDVSLPLEHFSTFIAAAVDAVKKLVPGCRPVPFGHLGDGNVHFNISQPEGADRAAFLAETDRINAHIHQLAAAMGGSISAEHGIGQAKIDDLYRHHDAVTLEVMESIKRVLDPRNILNPGKVFKPRD